GPPSRDSAPGQVVTRSSLQFARAGPRSPAGSPVPQFFCCATRPFVQILRVPSYWSLRGNASMEYHDKVLKCSECGAEFVFTGGEQMFFADKGFKNEPKRCKACKAKRAEGGGHAAPARTETKTNCSQCGKETTVPFRPTQGRPVFCRECFQQRRAMGAASARSRRS